MNYLKGTSRRLLETEHLCLPTCMTANDWNISIRVSEMGLSNQNEVVKINHFIRERYDRFILVTLLF